MHDFHNRNLHRKGPDADRECRGWQNHSAAFFGNQHGLGYTTMFYTYAANDIPVRSLLHNIEMDFREFEWSVLTIDA